LLGSHAARLRFAWAYGSKEGFSSLLTRHLFLSARCAASETYRASTLSSRLRRDWREVAQALSFVLWGQFSCSDSNDGNFAGIAPSVDRPSGHLARVRVFVLFRNCKGEGKTIKLQERLLVLGFWLLAKAERARGVNNIVNLLNFEAIGQKRPKTRKHRT